MQFDTFTKQELMDSSGVHAKLAAVDLRCPHCNKKMEVWVEGHMHQIRYPYWFRCPGAEGAIAYRLMLDWEELAAFLRNGKISKRPMINDTNWWWWPVPLENWMRGERQ